MRNLYILIRKTKTLMGLKREYKMLLLEAFFLSGIVRVAILVVPFKKLKNFMGVYNCESRFEIEDEQNMVVSKVGWAMKKVVKYTPWQSKCLVKALVVQQMLKRRKIYSTIYLGAGNDEKNNTIAHAWLRCGRRIVTGGEVIKKFKQVAKFCNEK